MSARHRRPAPLRHHFGLTAVVASALLLCAIILVHDGDPAILGSAVLFGRPIHGGHRPQHWDGRSSIAVTWDAWCRNLRTIGARGRRAAVLFGRWLLVEEHGLTTFKVAMVLAFVVAMIAASPAAVAIPVAAALLAGVVLGLVLAAAHRDDVVRPGSLLGGNGGSR